MWNYLSIRQPHAHAVITGEKQIENRSWETKKRGFLWIHAGVNKGDWESDTPGRWRKFYESLPSDESLTFGAIIGAVELIDCIPESRAITRFPDQEIYICGPWCFVFDKPRILKEPVPWKGNVGIRTTDLEPLDRLFQT